MVAEAVVTNFWMVGALKSNIVRPLQARSDESDAMLAGRIAGDVLSIGIGLPRWMVGSELLVGDLLRA